VKTALQFFAIAVIAAAAGFFAYRHFSVEVARAPAPELSLPTLDGGTATLSALRGQLVLVNFWATWCAPCLKEIPLLVQMQAQYGARGLQVLGPALDDPEQVRAMLPRLGFNYPILIGDRAVPNAMDALGDTLGALPFSVLISPDGYVVMRKHGEFEAAELTQLIEAHLPRS
jgi:thiol-disulfide isomerase/thioredoxin